jgi:3-isopropylmalate dehydratase small subunit
MGQYTFNNLKNYENFSKIVKKGDIVVVGRNFGCGSSRQQAVDCFKSLGVSVIIAESFGSIYERNAINNAMPILVLEDITKLVKNMDILSVDFINGDIVNITRNRNFKAKPFSKIQSEIYLRGGLLIK